MGNDGAVAAVMRDDVSSAPSPPVAGGWIGLIAGNGRFPVIFAENARKLGWRVSAVAHEGETCSELEQVVDRMHWVRVGQFGKVVRALKGDGVRQAVMLGGMKKTHLFSGVRPDFLAMALFAKLKSWKDDHILRALADGLQEEGITIRESTFGLSNILVPEGVLTRRQPSEKAREDVACGWRAARDIGRMDVGQCVVVKDRVIVAVEAVEGTDEAIRRGGRLARRGAVVVKRCKPQQDLRFDLPAIGPGTVTVMDEVKAAVLAVEAGKTIMLDREEMLERARRAGIVILGVPPDAPDAESRHEGG